MYVYMIYHIQLSFKFLSFPVAVVNRHVEPFSYSMYLFDFKGTKAEGPGQTGPGYPSTSFLYFWCYYFKTTLNFFFFSYNFICDEYVRYWINGMCLLNRV